MNDHEQTIEDLKFNNNYKKEMFLYSDSKLALISSAPSDFERDWFLTNQQMADARKKVNDEAGSRRLFAHMIFTPGQPGWLDNLDAGLALKPESCKGYTIGDNTHKDISRYPWRMDDEKVTYKGYERMVKAGIKNVCVHKGLFAPGVEKQFPNLRGFADVADVGQAAKDWPQLNFIIYHSAYRHVGGDPKQALAEFERTGRISWTSDLADIPAQYGVNNVYGDVGQLFATTLVAEPNVCAALMGTLIKGLGADHVCWGTDALWTGAPQWQIEGLRRLEIPEAMQKKFGYAPLGAAEGPVKTAIFGGNNARLYDIQPRRAMLELKGDRFSMMKKEYEKAGSEPSRVRLCDSDRTGGSQRVRIAIPKGELSRRLRLVPASLNECKGEFPWVQRQTRSKAPPTKPSARPSRASAKPSVPTRCRVKARSRKPRATPRKSSAMPNRRRRMR